MNATILNAAIHLLNTLLPMLYALAALAYLVDFFRDDRLATKATRPMLGLVISSTRSTSPCGPSPSSTSPWPPSPRS